MMRVKEAVVVEGRCDRAKLSALIDGTIVETGGFAIFNDRDKMELIRRLAAARGVIILTDSDGAGFLIRSKLCSCLPPEQVKHAYIPDIYGKERRKAKPSKEGKLGVEGMPPEVLLDALRQAGATFLDETEERSPPRRAITKADLYAAGYSGGEGAAQRRQELLKRLDLPQHLSPNALLEVLNALYGYEKLEEMGIL